jgi:hypothetical protein
MTSKAVSIVLAAGMLALAACASQTMIQSSWKDPAYQGAPFEHVAVVALFDTAAESRTFEQHAADALAERGVTVVQGHTILEDGKMYEQDELRARLADAGVDAILISRLIAVDERQVYRAPTPYMHVPSGVLFGDPFYWYYAPGPSYYWYWRSTYDVTHSPGYWEQYSYLGVETSLYDAREDRLVWTAKSSTMDDQMFQNVASSIAATVTRELVAMDIVGGKRRSDTRG